MLLLPNSCHKCGYEGESGLRYAGPHIKRVCGKCGGYIEFVKNIKIPDVKEIKLKIWAITEQDVEVINKAKKDIDFLDTVTGLDLKIQYWKLYLFITKALNIE